MNGLRRIGLYALLAVIFWAGAFGIAFGVVEWRSASSQPVTVIEQESPAPIQTGPTQAEIEAELCAAALVAAGAAASQPEAPPVRGIITFGGSRIPLAIQDAIDRYCR